ncbi:MAG: flagellar FliJ family protein [Alphaproteobacteria bacterium]|nr:flagellar FliJ family protein [Alphaproteobacteria bacterium]
MKGLATLMRLARAEIDARQRALAEIDARVAALDRDAAAHDRAMMRESMEATADPTAMAVYGAYVHAAIAMRADFARRRTILADEAQTIRAALNEAFIELKRLELLAERLATEEEKAAAAREGAALDEMAIARYARHG